MAQPAVQLFILDEEREGAPLNAANRAAGGRSAKLRQFADFDSIAEGSALQIVLPDGRQLVSHVNYSRLDPGLPSVRAIAAGFPNNNGGLSLYQDKVKGTVGGRIWLLDQEVAYVVETQEDKSVWMTEKWKSELLCAGAAKPYVLEPNKRHYARAPLPEAVPPPVLSSRPEASAVLYLDFDGEPEAVYPDWPASNPGGVSFACAAAELTEAEMTHMWRIVSEDYAPFNIDVTTDRARYDAANVGSRMRCIVTPSDTANPNGAGVAWRNSFAAAGTGGPPSTGRFSSAIPCWVPTAGYLADENVPAGGYRIMASAVSHEFGHTLGLSHDGTNPPAGDNYFSGHGTPPNDWSPIMGNYWGPGNRGRGIVQWSFAEYQNANNTEDDVEIIANATNGFGYVPDISTGTNDATPLTANGAAVTGAGLIEKSGEDDYFSVQAGGAGTVSFTVTPFSVGPMTANLSAHIELLDVNGTSVATANGADTAPVSVSFEAPGAGTYYLTVRGRGNRNAFTNGYSSYGSIGRYDITGTIPLPPDTQPPVVTITTPAHNSFSQAFTSITGTAVDNGGSGIAGGVVNFTLYHVNTSQYWTGNNWAASATQHSANVNGSGVWTYNGALPSAETDTLRQGQYLMSAFTHDNANNNSQPQSGVNNISFTVDIEVPTVAITSPADGSAITTSTYSFNGSASDPAGIERVVLFIQRAADGQFWNGSTWVRNALNANLGSVYDLNNQTWASAFALPVPGPDAASNLTNGSYNFIAIAFDTAGNQRQTDSVVTVDYYRRLVWTRGSFSDGVAGNDDYQWDNAANWAVDGVFGAFGIPGAGDFAVLELGDAVISNASRTVSKFRMTAGSLSFSTAGTSLTITKGGVWTGGTLSSTVNIGSGATFEMSGAGTKLINNSAVINNSGAATWAGPGLVRGYQDSTWNNKPGSSFTLTSDGDVFANYSSGNVFNNEAGASFVKSAGANPATSSIDEWTFNNAGKIDSQQGTLHFSTTLNLLPSANLAGAGRVLLGGTINLTTSVSSTGNPELIGTLNGNTAGAGFSGSQPFTWSSGTINGAFTLAAGSVLDLSTASTKQIGNAGVFTNYGRVNWKAGLLQGYQSSIFHNESGAIFDAVTDGDIFANHSSGNVFNNKAGALFLKSGRSGTPDGTSYVDEWTFNNSGVLRSDTGVLRFHTALNLNPGGAITRDGALEARVRSTYDFVLTGTTTVSNITFEAGGDWHGNLAPGTAGNGAIATNGGGLFEWTAGTAHNTVNIAPSSSFALSGSALKQIGNGGVLKNRGNATWTGTGHLQGYQDSTFANLPGATFIAATDADFVNYSSGNKFINAAGASFQKTTGSENTRCDWAFHNAGIAFSSSGALAMNNGGISSGTFVASGAGLIQFAGGQHDLSDTAGFEGSSKTQVTGGTVRAVNEVNADSAAGTLEIAGGTVTSAPAGSFNVLGNLTWTGGTIAGTFNVKPGSTFLITGAAVRDLGNSGVINNSGATTWTGPGLVRGYQDSTWNNKPGSSFTLTSDGDVFANYSSGNVFNNEAGASFVKSAGANPATSSIDEWTFNNAGKIDSQQGTLHFSTTLNLLPSANLAGAGRVLLGGTINLTTSVSSTGNPELIGTLNGNTAGAGFSGSQPFTWSSGTINGAFTLAAGSVLDLSTASTKQIGNAGVFTNYGRVNWKAGLLQGYQSSIFHNESGAIFDAVTDGDIFANHSSGNVFNNKAGALFLKSGRSGTPDGTSYVDEWTFNNSGVLRSDTGVLRFHTALNLNPGGAITRDGALDARVRSTNDFVLTGTTTVSNITFETGGDWRGNLASATAGNGTITTNGGGLFEWTAGTAHNTVTIAPGSSFVISGSALKQIGNGGVLNNRGNTTWTGSGHLQGYQNSTFANLLGATFIAATDADFVNYSSGNKFINDGTFVIGNLVGVTDMAWNYAQGSTGVLDLELAGTNAATPQFDQLRISGSANLAGTIVINLMNDYIPVPESTYPVLTYSSRIGTFETVHSLGSILDFQYNGSNLTLVAQAYPENNQEWKQYFFGDPNSPDAQPLADPDGDGIPNLQEYAFALDPYSSGGSGVSVQGVELAASRGADSVTVGGIRYGSISFTRPTPNGEPLTDVSYVTERTTTLVNPNWSSAEVVEHSRVPNADSTMETVTMRSTQPMSQTPREFMHVKLSLIP